MTRGHSWGAEGLDADAAQRWREQIHPFARRWITFFLGRTMRSYGYVD